jgi:phospholipid/cholesterol/gamma-HCH transport system substrate-binding protein
VLAVRRLIGVTAILAVVAGGTAFWFGGEQQRTYTAKFSRAVQVFPGGKVRVLGVDVGVITDVRNAADGVAVSFTVEDPDVQLPADVQAAIVPVSLLGERYVQLFPAYQGGAALQDGAVIPLQRTAVPAEPDELLRSLQDYLGAIDPATVSGFVSNAARLLEGNGAELNSLIEHAARVMETLSSKRDDLAEIIVQFERLTTALATRQEELGRLIETYNVVAGTLTTNRTAVEGTIVGLNDAAEQLASLLIAHRGPLHQDIRALTRTGRTIDRNVDSLAETGGWAVRLFRAASNAIDYNKDWLRLNNQGQELSGLIVMRIEDRLIELCDDLAADLGLPIPCATHRYWAREAPSLFCYAERCPPPGSRTDQRDQAVGPEAIQQEVTEAIEEVPSLADRLLEQARDITCADAEDRQRCLERKAALLKCADAARPRRCLEREAVQLACQGAANVRACLEDRKDQELQQVVEDILGDALGQPVDPGLGDPGGVVP